VNNRWSDEELRRSVEIYVLLLRLQLQGGDDRAEPLAQALLGGPLTLRNDAAIRYRMRNISAVVQELGGPILKDFSPAESVGSGVRPRIRTMLLEDPDFALLLHSSPSTREEDRRDALVALRILRQHIEDLERDLSWIGHNRPPDQEGLGIDRFRLRDALEDIDAIETQLEKPAPDKEVVATRVSRLRGLAFALAKWLGDRATKFVDAALVAAAPIAVAKVTGLLPTLMNAVDAITRALAH
jgi:hypothetical protein